MKIINALGVDLGNGYVKIVHDTQTSIEPAVFAYAPFMVFSHGDDNSIEINNEKLFLGMDAIESGLAITQAIGGTDSLNRYNSQEYENLLFGFIARFFKKDVTIENLALGLPNNHFTESSKILANKFKNDEQRVTIQGETYTIKIKNVHVLPQPFGVYLRDNNADKNVIVIDLGEGTNDYTNINRKGNINHMFSRDDGLKKYYLDVLRYLQQKYPSLYLELAEIPRYLEEDGIKDVDGRYIPVIDKTIANLKQQYSRNIMQPIIEQYDHMNQFDKIIVTGGGALAFNDTLTELRKDLPNIEVAIDPQIANAQGFYKYALSRVQNAQPSANNQQQQQQKEQPKNTNNAPKNVEHAPKN